MADQETKKEKIDRRSMMKTLGSAAATAAVVSVRAPQALAESLPPAIPPQQAKKEGGSSSKITGGKYMADFFNAYGVTAVFFMPAIMSRTLATIEMEGMPIKRVLTHGEKAAAYMADGYARVTGRPGICAAQAVGAANLAAGLRDAYMAHSPVIAIAGSPGPTEKYKYPYQMRPDDYPTFNQYTKGNYQVDIVERLPDLMRQAFRDATSETPGPVSMLLPGKS
jgi:acetolactate synthase-1/2/3 large subunit